MSNNNNIQLLILIHSQNSNDDPNNQIYDRDDLQDEPHPTMRADSQINDSLSNDSKFNKNDTQQIMTKAQIHNFPQNLQKPQQHTKIEMSTDNLKSQNRKFPLLPETQKITNDTFCSHDDQEIVMANDEAFGALDFQHNDIQLDPNNDLSQQQLLTFSDKTPLELSLDAQNQLSNSQNDDRNVLDIIPNDIPPNAQTLYDIPRLPTKDNILESDVENRPHTETEPQLPQQRDNVLTVDPVPESRYNLRNKNRLNPYTFSGKVSEKWIEAPRRNMRRPRSLDQKT